MKISFHPQIGAFVIMALALATAGARLVQADSNSWNGTFRSVGTLKVDERVRSFDPVDGGRRDRHEKDLPCDGRIEIAQSETALELIQMDVSCGESDDLNIQDRLRRFLKKPLVIERKRIFFEDGDRIRQIGSVLSNGDISIQTSWEGAPMAKLARHRLEMRLRKNRSGVQSLRLMVSSDYTQWPFFSGKWRYLVQSTLER